MNIKKPFLLAFVLFLSITNAQTQTSKILEEFDKGAAILEARKKGVPDGDVEGYVRAARARYMAQNHKHNPDEYIKKVTVINMNTKQITQGVQTSLCGNSDLSLLNYSNWAGDISDNNALGTTYPVNTYSVLGINGNNGSPVLLNTDPCNGNVSTDRHVVMSLPVGALTNNIANAFTNGYDPTCQNSSTGMFDLSVCPQTGVNSIRLGSAYPNYTGEKLSYQISVNSSNSLFTYRFAVVINDGSHGTGEQPAFTFQLKDANGNAIGGLCGQYDIDATAALGDTSYITTSSTCINSGGSSTKYRKWHTVTLDLSAYSGTNVTAEFETMDCIYSGHFCYAYISATCGALTANVSGFCGGSGSVVMTAPGGFASYQWYGPNTTTPISGATASTYTASSAINGDVFTVDCITLQGCTTKLSVTVASTNIVASGASVPSCRGGNTGSASVSVVGGTQFTYSWTPTVSTTTTITSQPPGNYSVTVHDISVAHCPDTTIAIQIGQILPTLTSTVAQLCGNIVAPALTSPGNGPYSWTFNNGTSVLATTQSYAPTTTITPSDYFVVTSHNATTGCLDSLKTTFSQVNIGFTSAQTNPCNGGNNGSITLTPSAGNTFTNFDWSLTPLPGSATLTPNGGGPSLSATGLTDPLHNGTTYTVAVNATGNTSCVYTLTVTLNDGALPPPALETLKGCALENVSVPSFTVPGLTHSWYSGGIALGSSYPYITTGVTNNVVYTDTMRDANGCISIYKGTIKLQSFNATISSAEGIHCHGDSTGKIKVTATAETNGPLGHPYTFNWVYPSPYTSPAMITTGVTPPQVSQQQGLHPGTYTVVIHSGACVSTKTYSLVDPAPLNDDTLNAFFCPKDDSALICVTELGHATYTWLNNHVVVPNYKNDSIWVPTGNVGNYMAAYLDGGCKDTAKVLITFPSYHAFRPESMVNVFTPNADNRNDVFFPFYTKNATVADVDKQTEYYHMYIYNRWGKLVFETEEYSKGWDGKDQSGAAQDDGTYFYVLKYKSNCSTKADLLDKKGFVQLLR